MNKTRVDWAEREWLPIPGFDDYCACRDGCILSLKGEMKILKGVRHQSGHLYVFLYQGTVRSKKYIHDLVLLAFVGAPQPGQLCRHLDGKPEHNDLTNLQWGSYSENTNDMRLHGTIPRGERSGTHKLTEVDVIEIRKLHGKVTLRELGKRFGVSHTAIRRAATGMKWGHLGG